MLGLCPLVYPYDDRRCLPHQASTFWTIAQAGNWVDSAQSGPPRSPSTTASMIDFPRHAWTRTTPRLRAPGLMACVVMALMLCAPVSALQAAQARFNFSATPSRLSKEVMPQHVRLHVVLDPKRDRFEGKAIYTLSLSKPQTGVTLHARGLSPRDGSILDNKGRATPVKIRVDQEAQLWRVTPATPLAAGKHTLQLRWDGPVHTSGEGLFRAGDRQQPMLATQLEAIHARAVFPAFDEPAYRVRYSISIDAPAGLQALSNMPELAHKPAGQGLVTHQFATTPPMPSYLVALAVGQLDALRDRYQPAANSKSRPAVPLAIYTTPGKSAYAAYAMQATQQLLPYFEAYFGQPYSLPKLDQIAVPSTRGGAMEDWGLISYIEGALLYNAALDEPRQQQRVFRIVAHEIAHQWFGNLVTAASWNEIWLNEAFATWIAQKAEHHFNPNWQVPLTRRVGLERVLARDASSATRPIRGGDVAEQKVFDVFDSITYDKGGAVLTMLEQWLGPEVFQRGLQAYMRDRRMSNATAGDLWHHLGQAAGRDVKAVAAAWTDHTGYPMVSVSERCELGKNLLTLEQTQFAQLPSVAAPASPSSQKIWPIPVRMVRAGESRTVLLNTPSQQLEFGHCGPQATLVNAGGEGFFRARYVGQSQTRLLEQFQSLPATDKVSVFSDMFALVQAGEQPVGDWFALVDQLAHVNDASRPSLYELAAEGMNWLAMSAGPGPLQAKMSAKMRHVLAAELRRLGWQPKSGEDFIQTRLRARLIERLAMLDDPDVLAQVDRWFAALAQLPKAQGLSEVDPSIRAAVIHAAGRNADAARIQTLLKLYDQADTFSERRTFVHALSFVRDPALTQQVMELALGDRVQKDMAVRLPGDLAEDPQHSERVYAFVSTHWQTLAERVGSGPFGERAWLLPRAAHNGWTEQHVQRLLADQQAKTGDVGKMAGDQVAQRIRLRASWHQRFGVELNKLLPDS